MILYLETNFIMGEATGRETGTEELLAIPRKRLRIALPCLCVMEALSAFEREGNRRKELTNTFESQMSQLSANVALPAAARLRRLLKRARLANRRLAAVQEKRLFAALARVLARAECIPWSESAFRNAFGPGSALSSVRDQCRETDLLILGLVLEHSRRHGREPRGLLTGDAHFRRPQILDLYRTVGIDETFSRTRDFLAWWREQQTRGQRAKRPRR
jgi:hypothetical protein